MIRYNETFPTRAAAEEFKTRVYASYHPAGYGTSLTISETEGTFRVTGYRYSSCD
ncbi:hypothetical protein [Sinorhizobium meliloti]|uniref:hypothetical protein n=1 Tax=Rhizobium meliloti TaxID=382 RepID=UPI0013E3E617|nr:hypothetical protein [Sinorhizobium meliloti]